MIDHRDHLHADTPAARAECRVEVRMRQPLRVIGLRHDELAVVVGTNTEVRISFDSARVFVTVEGRWSPLTLDLTEAAPAPERESAS